MSPDTEDALGHIIDVEGGVLTAILEEGQPGEPLEVTIGDEDIIVGRLGSYLRVQQGAIAIVGIVTRMSEQEKLSLADDRGGVDSIRVPVAQRIVRVLPIGTLSDTGVFSRGVPQYPTPGAKVYPLGNAQLQLMLAEYVGKHYRVGCLSSSPDIPVYLDPSVMFGRHFAILGQTGAGKSWTVASLLQRAVAVMPRAHIIILDLHGEYHWVRRDNTTHSAFNEGVARYVDARKLEIPYWLMTFSELCDLFIDRTEHTAHNQLATFRDIVAELRTEEGTRLGLSRTSVDTPVYFELGELRRRIDVKNGLVPSASTGKMVQGPLTGAFDNFLMRLDSRLNDVRYDFLMKPTTRTNSNTLEGLLRDFVGLGNPKRAITVLDLSSVPFDVRPTVAAQVGRLAFEFSYWNPRYREFPLALICEEAHNYIPRSSEVAYAGARRSMERIAKEGRKYGVGLGVVSQRPHELSETVLAQCGTFLCLRLTNPEDQAYVRGLAPEGERDLVNVLAGLGRGEMIVLGDAAPLPTRVRVDAPSPAPDSNDVDYYESWLTGPEDLDIAAVVDRWRRQSRD